MTVTHTLESLPDLLGPRELALLYEALEFKPTPEPQYQAENGARLVRHITRTIRDRIAKQAEAERNTTPVPEKEWLNYVCSPPPIGKFFDVVYNGGLTLYSVRHNAIDWPCVKHYRECSND